jgi:hypothetical protein
MSKFFICFLFLFSFIQDAFCQNNKNTDVTTNYQLLDPEAKLKDCKQDCHKIHGCVPKPDEEGGYDCSNGNGWFECITTCQDNNREYAKQFWAKICADPNATEEVKSLCNFQN